MAPAPSPRLLLVHGAALTAASWHRLVPLLEGCDVVAVERASTGELEAELDALTALAEDRFVVGVSGGATLGLALAAGPARLAGALLHEPAVGSLLPGLLAPVAEAFRTGGVAAFATTLYGPSWTPDMAPAEPGAVDRDLAMFRAFEPSAPRSGQGPVTVTVGSDSPPVRAAAAAALAERFGVATAVLPGCRHFVQHDAPAVLARAVRDRLGRAAIGAFRQGVVRVTRP